MIAQTGLRWTLTALFAVVTAFGLYQTARPVATGPRGVPAARLTHLLHAVMGAAMLAMAWPWGTRLPVLPQAVLFGAAAVWFLLVAVVPGSALRNAISGGHARIHSVLHAAMMGTMAWMVAAMSASMTTARHAPGGVGTASMPGMAMPGGGPGTAMGLHGGSRVAAGVLAGCFTLIALWWLARAFDAARGVSAGGGEAAPAPSDRAAYDAGCHGVMALGMAVMLLVMV